MQTTATDAALCATLPTPPAKPKRTRKGGPKNKTGCLTCRARRVRCDEVRGPSMSCLRCQKHGSKCTWPVNVARLTTCHALLPKPLAESQHIAGAHSVVSRPLQKNLFQSDREYHSFKNFTNSTSHQLSGCFPSDLWSTIILQASESEPTVRKGIIALGALDMTSYDAILAAKSNLRLATPLSRRTVDESHEFALRQYSKAIAEMARAEAAGRQSLRTRLMCIILTACFETYHGNHEQTILQVQMGVQMVLEILHQQFSVKSTAVCHPQPPECLLDIVEDELIQAFARFDVLLGVNPSKPHFSRGFEMARAYEEPLLNAMPEVFSSIKEARCQLERLIRCSFNRENPIRGAMPRQAKYSISIIHTNEAGLESVMSRDNFPYAVTKDDAERAKKIMKRWEMALEKSQFLRRPSETWQYGDYLAATALKLSYLMTKIRISFRLAETQVELDQYLPEFKEMVSLGAILVHNNSNSLFTFDTVYILPLSTVALVCRCPATRRKAIELLSKTRKMEWGWDSVLVARVLETVMRIEENYITDGGFVPEHARVRGIEVYFNDITRSEILRCWQRTPDGEDVQRSEPLISPTEH